MPKRKKIILTGFGPFGDYPFNPVKESTEYFHGKVFGQMKQRQVIGVVLPCSYFGAFQMLSEIIDKEKPEVIISTGLSSGVRGIRFETTFHNMMEGKYPDNDGFQPVGLPIKTHGADFYEATADVTFLSNKLNLENIPTEISNDADRFICNSLGYLTSRKIANERLHIKNTFIHVPWTDDYKDRVVISPKKIYLGKEIFFKAVEILLNVI